jgi:PAS domain-containing protein
MKLVSVVAERTREAAQRASAEAALAESEKQYRTLFASIDEGFCTIEVLFDDSGEAVDYRFL